MEQAKRRKDLVKAMSACAAGPKMVEEDDATRNRASRTPSTITSTPSTKTPGPKGHEGHRPDADQTLIPRSIGST